MIKITNENGDVFVQVPEEEMNQMKFEQMKFDRMEILLKAMVDIVKKLDNTPYVLSFFEQTAVWDGTDCDGYCLFEEAKEVLQIEE